MKHLGDITKIHGDKIPAVDCISFGSPCQDLSIAGKRAGLSGERSGLFMDAIRIIKEMREHELEQIRMRGTNELPRPYFAIYENVPGAFSSNGGEDFRCVLEELAKIKEPEFSLPRPTDSKGRPDKWAKAGLICGDTWSIAWRTMDAQFWGVPQRRKRITIVMDLRGQCAGEILFEQQSVSGYPCESIPPWEGIARNPEECTGECNTESASTLQIRSGCEGGGKGTLIQTERTGTLSTVQDKTLFNGSGIDVKL